MLGSGRGRATTLGVVLALILMCSACDWTQYMGGPGLNGNTVAETTITTANAAQLTQVYSVPVGTGGAVATPPTSSAGSLYESIGGRLVVASAGSSNCSGTPLVCQPLWTASPGTFDFASQPLVSGGTVYVTFGNDGSSPPGLLAAYDAAGTTNCSGSPKVCQPIWTANVSSVTGPNLDHGTLFVNDAVSGQLEAFDAAGTTNCQGSPKVCTPLWTAASQSISTASVGAGLVYVVTGGLATSPEVEVYDETGTTSCAGNPKVCSPLWVVPVPHAGYGSVAISNGVGYVETGPSGTPSQVVAFDATGTTGCSGTPVVCQPTWTAMLRGFQFYDTPAVGDGRVFVPSISANGAVDVFDAAGTSGCSGSPKVCVPLSQTALDPHGPQYYFATPELTNALLLIDGRIYDAAGSNGCTAAVPTVCTPLWTAPLTAIASDLANGTVFVLGTDGSIHAYRVPGT